MRGAKAVALGWIGGSARNAATIPYAQPATKGENMTETNYETTSTAPGGLARKAWTESEAGYASMQNGWTGTVDRLADYLACQSESNR